VTPRSLIAALGVLTLPAAADERLIEFLDIYCVDCHDSSDASGEVDLEPYIYEGKPIGEDGRLLELLELVLASEEMPPSDEVQPTAEERRETVDSLDQLYRQLAAKHRDDPGMVVMPRLTKAQFRHAIRDLSDGVVSGAGRYLPSEGGAGEGFDNVGLAQSLETAQLEKFLEAARLALRHLRANPADGLLWREVAREPVDAPADARLEAVNDVIGWFTGEQLHWAREFTSQLAAEYGSGYSPFLEVVWRFEHRAALGRPDASLRDLAASWDTPLPPVPTEKWHAILTADKPPKPFRLWAERWRQLPPPGELGERPIRDRCLDIALNRDPDAKPPREDYAPPYELSFADPESREKVIRSAKTRGIWPFEIEIGDAEELFLVLTMGGDDNNGDHGIWRRGKFHFADGSTQPWHKVTKIRGANSGNIFKWAIDDNGAAIAPDAIGQRAPGALKFQVPEGAVRLEVELTINKRLTDAASVQALILKEKPKRQGFIPGRLIFGGKVAGAREGKDPSARERSRLLGRINIPGANRTKAGLNAERNVFSDWERTPVAFIGGPWDHQEGEDPNPDAPFHLTTAEALDNATPEALAELERRLDRVEAIARVPHQKLHQRVLDAGFEKAREGAALPDEFEVTPEARELLAEIEAIESDYRQRTRRWVGDFARQAWRRPLRDGELEVLMDLYREARADGLGYDAAIKQSLLAVLASPHFLYRLPVRVDGGDEVVPLSPHELASRLAFFLWASLPDDELLARAEDGSLVEPTVLREQVRRMIDDPRSAALASDFAGQLFGFLGFENHTSADPERFPEFTPEIREAMIAEVRLFFEAVVRGEAPLTDLLDADYSYLNPALADFYGIEPGEGPGFQRVAVPSQRGGLLTMGLFLTKTSEPLRTSPVVRGTWVLESVLGRHLPSPPPVPAISQDETDELGRSIREQLEAHREDPSCASCHAKIDPLGIALENFDPIGRWRETLRSGDPPDTHAVTKDGVTVDSPQKLKAYLVGRSDEVMRHLTRKLLGYALGRLVEPGDLFLLERLQRELPNHDHRFDFLVEEIVLSPQFRHRR